MTEKGHRQPDWQGGHHLALATRDLDATVRFYHGLLGMALIGAMRPGTNHGPHCFLRAGSFVMHFFQQPDAVIATAPPGWVHEEFTPLPGAYQHIALALKDQVSLLSLHDRLVASDVPVTELRSDGPIQSFLFTDNNGIVLEANWSLMDTASMPIDYSHPELFNDPDPVPAVKELIHEGRLRV